MPPASSSRASSPDIEALEERARSVRLNVLRAASGKGEGYVGQALGCADMLTACYFHAMSYDPDDPEWTDRDRFILSTGHYALVLYATLAEVGVLEDDQLDTYGADESPLTMTTEESTPGVELTSGSLGQGLSNAVGMALGAGLRNEPFRVFNFLSDGELQEGATWEAAMSAAHFGLGNLTALVDNNRVQADGHTAEIMNVEPIEEKWESFGWRAHRIDGNDMSALVEALDASLADPDRPHVLVCDTVMGSGVPFIEQREKGHFVRVEEDEWQNAVDELRRA
mgnify:CR=1 FL=1